MERILASTTLILNVIDAMISAIRALTGNLADSSFARDVRLPKIGPAGVPRGALPPPKTADRTTLEKDSGKTGEDRHPD
ncbi:hypothetical protein [Burkholderia seminalis]|uniref:hypothetical protein n=1 Tax=Burkholderia seminalis TaxID=488731 RepID=UPI001903E3FF|nr:hypothetical protein [Burkholderia seminalis]MBJ9965355.1 hypothetical protein [Burkholderia seminalis]